MKKRFKLLALLMTGVLLLNSAAMATDVINGDISPEEGFKGNPEGFYRQDKMYFVASGYVGTDYQLDLPVYMQKTDYFGGPACVEMIVDYYLGPVNNQEIYAEDMGTDLNGTEIGAMMESLNTYQKDKKYIKGKVDSEYHLVNMLIDDFKNGFPVVADISTEGKYQEGLWDYSMPGHYVLLTGFRVDENENAYVTVLDPYLVGKREVKLEDVYEMINEHWDRSILY